MVLAGLEPKWLPHLTHLSGTCVSFRFGGQVRAGEQGASLAVRTAMSIGPTAGEHLRSKKINLSKSSFNPKSLTHQPIKYFLSK